MGPMGILILFSDLATRIFLFSTPVEIHTIPRLVEGHRGVEIVMRGILRFIALLALPACCGCLAMPNLEHPGTEARQQRRADVFDPYPSPGMGPPVQGARPQEYEEPRAEVTRALERPPGTVLPACPQPQVLQSSVVQPPVVTAPPIIYCPPVSQP